MNYGEIEDKLREGKCMAAVEALRKAVTKETAALAKMYGEMPTTFHLTQAQEYYAEDITSWFDAEWQIRPPKAIEVLVSHSEGRYVASWAVAQLLYDLDAAKRAPNQLDAAGREVKLLDLIKWMAQCTHNAHHAATDADRTWHTCSRGFCGSVQQSLKELGLGALLGADDGG